MHSRKFFHWFQGFALTLCLSATCFLPTAEVADLDDPVRLESFIDGVVQPLMKNHNSPSGTVAIVKDGQLIFAKGYGYQDIEKQIPVDPYRTLFRPGSVSKLFTWVAVMQLAEQGKVDLDRDVNEYLQSFKIRETFEEPITLRHILTHTAGFEDGGAGYLIVDDVERIMSLRDALEQFQPERVNPPGAQTAYSNYATALAGHIVALVSGLSFNEYIEQNILEPLGMSQSTFEEPLPPNLADDMAISYAMEKGRYVEKPFELVASFGPAGAMSASSVDMVKFGQAILNGGELNGRRILRPETVVEMLDRAFTHHGGMMGMALGFYEADLAGVRVLGHGGDTQWFHSNLAIDLQHGLAMFVSFGAAGGGTVRSSLPEAFFSEYFAAAEPAPKPPEDFNERAGKYAGTYKFWRGNFSQFEKALGLAGGGIQVAPSGENTLILMGMGGAKQYVEVGENLFQEQDSKVSLSPGLAPRLLGFQENEAGEITGFVLDGLPFMSTYKAAFYQTGNFSLTLLALSLIVFLAVILRRLYQRAAFRALPDAERKVQRAAALVAIVNVLVLVIGVIVIATALDNLFGEVPTALKLFLWLPFLVVLAELYMLQQTFMVWKDGLLTGAFARLRYTAVALAGLFMCWFYWYWNLIGPQYLV